MKFIHIIAGLLALMAGAVALYAPKGSWLHRRSGMVFAIAMLVLTTLGAAMASIKPDRGTAMAGVLTFYLVSTALLTVRRSVERARGLLTGLMLVALTVSAFDFALGFEGLHSANGRVDGLPPQPIFMFAIVGLLAVLGDARMLWTGSIEGAQRIARHLWRMTFAMWIATSSFFMGQAKFLPEPLRPIGLRAIPVLLVLVLMFYWLGKVLLSRRRAAAVTAMAPDAASPH